MLFHIQETSKLKISLQGESVHLSMYTSVLEANLVVPDFKLYK